MHYKLGKTNILTDALLCRSDFDPRSALRIQKFDDDEDNDQCAMCVSLNLTRFSPESCLFDKIVATYANDPDYADIITFLRVSATLH